MISHHPEQEHLLQYAAGTLPAGQALVIATHLTYCPACRTAEREAEAIGGAMLEDESAAPLLRPTAPADLGQPVASAPKPAKAAVDVPAPLRPHIGDRFADASWRTFWPGMQTIRLQVPGESADIRLLRVAAGKGMPSHSHGGDELTLCLQGSFTDQTGRYAVGDVALADQAMTHRQVADPGDACICLTVFDAPLKFASPWARLASLWVLR